MQLRINYNNILFRREVKQNIKKLSAISLMNHDNYRFYSSKSMVSSRFDMLVVKSFFLPTRTLTRSPRWGMGAN